MYMLLPWMWCHFQYRSSYLHSCESIIVFVAINDRGLFESVCTLFIQMVFCWLIDVIVENLYIYTICKILYNFVWLYKYVHITKSCKLYKLLYVFCCVLFVCWLLLLLLHELSIIDTNRICTDYTRQYELLVWFLWIYTKIGKLLHVYGLSTYYLYNLPPSIRFYSSHTYLKA